MGKTPYHNRDKKANRMKILPTVLLIGAMQAVAQVPTITKITFDPGATDNTSFRVFVNTAQTAWVQVRYGTSVDNYPYNTKTIQSTPTAPVSLTVGGLTPGTTYYVTATARPDPSDDNNICTVPACGATEVTVTTTGSTQAELPIPPVTWNVVHPDTSGYTTVPIAIVNQTTGECGAKRAVTSRDGWRVSAGDTIAAIMSEVGYGTVLEFDQGVACIVPYQSPGYFVGYSLASKAIDPQAAGNIDSPNHRYIVFRTQTIASADFPPFGVRVTPAWSTKMAKLYIQFPPRGVGNPSGQVFEGETGTRVHHYWFENLEMAPNPLYSNPPDSVDPSAFQYFFRIGSQYQSANNEYMVLDRLYLHGWPPPIRQYAAIELGGNYQAMLGCYLSQIQTWRMAAWPQNAGTLDTTSGILSIPTEQYRFRISSPALGMSAPAIATLEANSGYTGNVVGNLYKDHLELQFSSGSASISCSACVATQTATPATPYNAYTLFTGQIVGGQFTNLSWNIYEYSTSQYLMALGVQWTDTQSQSGPYLVDNNYMDGVGEGFYIDSLYSNYGNDDVTYTHNHNIWPKNYFLLDPNWIGYRFDVRQHWEMKRGHRYNLTGNVFSYSWSFQNEGPAIFLSARPQYVPQTLDSGVTDVTVKSNIMSHMRSAIDCLGISPMDNGGNQSDPQALSRVNITNNLMFDLGRSLYCDPSNCPGFQSVYFTLRPGCQNVTIKNNTGGIMKGDFPAWLYIGGGDILASYLDMENNIFYLSAGASTSSPNVLWGGILTDWPTAGWYSGYPVKPDPSASYNNNFSTDFSNVPDFKGEVDNTYVNIGRVVTKGAYTWKNNIGIGGYVGAAGATTDMTQAQLTAMSSKMPPGDIYVRGNTQSARETAVRFENPSKFDYRITGPSAYISNPAGTGVNYDQLYSDAGYVTSIGPVRRSPTGAFFSYTAPDARGCYVDYSPDGTQWTRQADGGGPRARSVTLSGLIPSTTYTYRILCYFEQANDGVLYTDYRSDQITDGSFQTPETGAGTLSFQFAAASIPGAVRVDVTLSPVLGAPVTASCSGSPCTIPAPIGDYLMTSVYIGAGEQPLTSGSPSVVSVR
jgi:hypothetical protein